MRSLTSLVTQRTVNHVGGGGGGTPKRMRGRRRNRELRRKEDFFSLKEEGRPTRSAYLRRRGR